MAELITGLDAARVRANVERVRERIAQAARRAGRDPAEVELLAAVKYVALDELETLASAGLTVLGENRAQELAAKAEAYPDFTWDFIGHLQSRKVRDVVPHASLIHSVASDSALAQLARHARPETRILVEVNVAGEASKSGITPAELPAFLDRAPVPVVGLMTMPPLAARPEDNRRSLRRAARAGSRARAVAALDGHLAGLRGRRRGGRHDRAPRVDPVPTGAIIPCRDRPARREPLTVMAFRDTWHRTLVYFGLAVEDEYDDDPREPAYHEPEAELEDRYRERPNVRRLSSSRRRRDEIDDIFADDAPAARTTALRPVPGPGAGRNGRDVRVHLVVPKSFNDAQDVADKFKDRSPSSSTCRAPTRTCRSA